MKKYVQWLLLMLLPIVAHAAVLERGPITVTGTLQSRTVVISDLLGLVVQGLQSVDLGKYYTQEQILRSSELKRSIDNGWLTVSYTGTDPDVEYIVTSSTAPTPVTLPVEQAYGVTTESISLESVIISSWTLTEVFPSATAEDRLVAFGQNGSDAYICRVGNYPAGTPDPKAYILTNGKRVDPGQGYKTNALTPVYAVCEPGEGNITILREIER